MSARKMSITSVNLQGGKSDIFTGEIRRLQTADHPSFTAFQEMGKPPEAWNLQPHPTDSRILVGTISGSGGARSSPRRGSALDVAVLLAEAKPGKRAPNRNNLGIIGNRRFSAVEQIRSGKQKPGLRNPLAVMTEVGSVATVHEASGVHKFAASQSGHHWEGFTDWSERHHPYARPKRARSASVSLPRAMVGDFNSTNPLLNAAVSQHGGGNVVTPAGATHQSGGTLDHGIFSVPATVTAGSQMAGDHMPHVFTFDAPTLPSSSSGSGGRRGSGYGPIRSKHSQRSSGK